MSEQVESKPVCSESGTTDQLYFVEVKTVIKPEIVRGVNIGTEWQTLEVQQNSGFGVPVETLGMEWAERRGFVNWEAALALAWTFLAAVKAEHKFGIHARLVRCKAVYSFAITRDKELDALQWRGPDDLRP